VYAYISSCARGSGAVAVGVPVDTAPCPDGFMAYRIARALAISSVCPRGLAAYRCVLLGGWAFWVVVAAASFVVVGVIAILVVFIVGVGCRVCLTFFSSGASGFVRTADMLLDTLGRVYLAAVNAFYTTQTDAVVFVLFLGVVGSHVCK
jgi:hypothetical protein